MVNPKIYQLIGPKQEKTILSGDYIMLNILDIMINNYNKDNIKFPFIT